MTVRRPSDARGLNGLVFIPPEWVWLRNRKGQQKRDAQRRRKAGKKASVATPFYPAGHHNSTGRITGRTVSRTGIQNGGHYLDDHHSMQLDTTTTTITSRPRVPELDYVQPCPTTSRIPWTKRNRTETVRRLNSGGRTAMSNMSGVNTHPSDTIQNIPFFPSILSNFRGVPFYVGRLGHRQGGYRKQGVEAFSKQSLRPGYLKRPRTVLDVDQEVAA